MKMSGKIGFGVAGITAMLAFAVNAALPSGYTELQYIQGTGDARAYICADDIYINPQTDRIETTFEVGSSGADGHSIWCARTDWQTCSYSLLWGVSYKANKLMFQASYSSASGTYDGRDSDPAVLNTKVTVTAEGNSWNVETANGISMSRTWPATLDTSFTKTGGPLFLFAAANGTTVGSQFFSPHKLYSFKIYTRSGDEYTLSHDLVPAKRDSDGSAGLFDAATETFYGNNGNGAFIESLPVGITTLYYCGGTDDYTSSSLTGTGEPRGWAISPGGSRVRAGMQPNLVHIVTNGWIRLMGTESPISTPSDSTIVVSNGAPGIAFGSWGGAESCSVAINSLEVKGRGKAQFAAWGGPTSDKRDGDLIFGGDDWNVESGSTIHFCLNTACWDSLACMANVRGGTGSVFSAVADYCDPATFTVRPCTLRVNGDMTQFKGDIVVASDVRQPYKARMELVNEVSIPGDPPRGTTSYVVITNGATLIVDQDWVSPKNRIWDFGSGAKPTIEVAEGKTVTVNGPMLGSSGFIKRGPGTLVLAGSVSGFSGDCEVFSGKVRLEGGAAKLAPLFRRKESISLPDGYTMLENLSLAGGANNSYIDTGYTPQSGAFGFFFDYMPNVAISANTGSRVMGSSLYNKGGWGGVLLSNWTASSDASGMFCFGIRDVIPTSGGQVGFTRMRMSLVLGRAELSRGWRRDYYMTDVDAAKFSGSVYVGNIHCSDSTTPGAPMSVYRYKIFESERLVHDFVPVKRTSDGAVGLYDTFGGLGFRPAADAQYIAAGPAYSGSDSEWLEVVIPSGFLYILR